MATPFIAEIRIFGFNFAPIGWATCDGQLIPIAQNTALFSLLGTNYGGNGFNNFGLPNLQGCAPMAWGQGPGLSNHFQGEIGGQSNVTLSQTELPQHTHTVPVPIGASSRADRANATGNFLGSPADATYASTSANAFMSANMVAPAGSGLPHNNLQPYLTMNFCIALQGIFPARS